MTAVKATGATVLVGSSVGAADFAADRKFVPHDGAKAGPMSDRREKLIRDLFAAHNRQDADGVVGLLSPDADWPDYLGGGGRLVGQDAVRQSLHEQFKLVRATAVPIEITRQSDGRYYVRALQTVHHIDGQLWTEDVGAFHFTFDDADRFVRLDPAD